MKKPYLSPLLLVFCVAFAVPVQAEKADRFKPAFIGAEILRYDDVKQVQSFIGNVILTKGSILMRAARVDMREDADGYQFGVITGTPDKAAFFRQKREGLDEFIEVESERIDYDGRADVVKFTGKVQFRRLRGAVVADEISGELMVYENLTDKFSVDGSLAGTTEQTPHKRVHAMLTPKPEAAASVPQPKASAPTVPTLRSTGTLGSSPQ